MFILSKDKNPMIKCEQKQPKKKKTPKNHEFENFKENARKM